LFVANNSNTAHPSSGGRCFCRKRSFGVTRRNAVDVLKKKCVGICTLHFLLADVVK